MYFLQGQNNRGAGGGDAKFHRHHKMGIDRPQGSSYRDWSYDLVHHRTGTTVKRTVYHATILDPHGNRIAHLRDFPTLQAATKAAQEWIDQRLKRLAALKLAIAEEAAAKLRAQEK